MIKAKQKIQKSRLSSILDRIEKHSDKLIVKHYKHRTVDDIAYGLDRIMEFAVEMKWEGKERDTVELLSFLLGLIDESSFHYPCSVTDALNDAFERLTEDKTEDIDNHIKNAEKALRVWKRGFKRIKEVARDGAARGF